MGVHGLWRLIEPSGKPVPLETLENKVLAVDVSIWLHQAIRGFQDSKGAPVPNAHLLGIYHRVCKLLYFKIKPIFVFDGGVPALKKQTIAKRNQLKYKNSSEADRLQKQLLTTLMKHSAISKVLSEKAKSSITAQTKKSKNNLFELPKSELDTTLSSSDDEENSTTGTDTDSSPTKPWDLHTIDMNSSKFKSLPVDVRHEILTELKETRKQSSWGRIHEIPTQSDDFSTYQMKRLLQRQAVQAALEEAAKEMGGASLSLAELESLLKDQGVPTTNDVGQRIASDENTRYLYIKDVKEAIARARKEQIEREAVVEVSKETLSHNFSMIPQRTTAEMEKEENMEKAKAFSLQQEPSTSKDTKLQFSFLEGFNDGDFQSDSSEDELDSPPEKKALSSAASYMIEYSGLTPNEIQKIIDEKTGKAKTRLMAFSLNNIKGKIKEKIMSQDDRSDVIVIENVERGISTKSFVKSHFNDESLKNNVEVTGVSNNGSVASESPKSSKDVVENLKVDKNKAEQEIVVVNSSVSNSSSIKDEKLITKTIFLDEVDKDGETSSSDSDDLMEVPDDFKHNEKIEIKIDPSEPIDDDLFGDIFQKNDTKEIVPMEIIIDLQKNIDDDLFEDVFKKEEELKNNNLELAETETIVSSNAKDEEVNELKIPATDDVLVKSRQTQNTEDLDSVEPENNMKLNVNPQLSIQEMEKLKDNLQQEKIDILVEKSSKERLASNITDQMYKEAQELLELFGVPYIIAPMEAEAQCAFLDSIKLTDGTITDDSDIWLFGGRTVYKNFFNQSKYVMEFNAENIKHHFKLSREQMILLALLVGSDYTTGIQGIGPVTALEILSAFPPNLSTEISLSHGQLLTGLREFKTWFNRGKTGGVGRTALKNKLTNITFSESFPSLQVVEAYLQPTVETSEEKFSWAKPDILALTVFAKDKFGWSSKKTDEILKPVIKKLEENLNQKSIKDFFKGRSKVHSSNIEGKLSKRVKSALDRFGKTEDELIAEEMLELEKEKKTRKRTKKRNDHCPDSNTNGDDVPNNVWCGVATENQVYAENEPSKKRACEKKQLLVASGTKTSKTDKNMANHNTSSKPVRRRTGRNGKNIPKDAGSENNLCEESEQTITITSSENTEVRDRTILQTQEECIDELKVYRNLAAELKLRRKRQNEHKDTSAKKNDPKCKKRKQKSMEHIPEEFKEDEDIRMFIATTSKSATKIEQIDKEVEDEFKRKTSIISAGKNVALKNKNEVIHQRLREKSNNLKNKLKAIEVYRKSRKGPGYVEKRQKIKFLPKDDAGLSEDSE